MTQWANFFVAIASASAALTGLIFIGVSISLAKVLSIPGLTGRALGSRILLMTMLVVASLSLVPAQAPAWIGSEFLIVGLIIWIATLSLDIGMLTRAEAAHKKHYRLNILFTQLAVLPYIISGLIIFCNGLHGVYWLVPGIVFSFIKALIDAWVLLVEIHR
jgi:modulator of FtsH protease